MQGRKNLLDLFNECTLVINLLTGEIIEKVHAVDTESTVVNSQETA